ncbi:tyrosine-type recombinase/integrase [Actinomadura kijaniata]|uniref:tyrosine-type recombinase/integrase n=1 Tax=Actinomadura kijaniata TaxID=46161 RepID=UPI0028A8FBC6|nr:tyrosine-type recombinase/integrase [Actinomadura namibiensis]
MSARKGKVIVRSGKGETSREIPLLDGTARVSVTEWRTECASWPGAADNPVLLLNQRGGRLSTRAVDQLIDELATDAEIVDDAGALALSAHTLRHTLATNLLRAGVDIVVAAELLGHARLDTTRRYTLPTHTDLEDAVGRLPTDQ